jgi:hypothetical protein
MLEVKLANTKEVIYPLNCANVVIIACFICNPDAKVEVGGPQLVAHLKLEKILRALKRLRGGLDVIYCYL